MSRIVADEPQIGEIRHAREFGYKSRRRYIYVTCPTCYVGRWLSIACYNKYYSKDKHMDCRNCAARKRNKSGAESPSWKGGRCVTSSGYILIKLEPNDFFFPMATSNVRGYVFEHRLVMAKHLQRNLQLFEIVHHKNGIRGDNRLENLELTVRGSHIINHNKGYKDGYSKGLLDGKDKQIQELKELIENQTKQIRLLQFKLNEVMYV